MLPELGDAGRARRRGAARCCCTAPSTRRWSMPLAPACGAVVVDDLHFADDASIEFLQALVQSDALAALHWGFAQRPAEAGAAARADARARSRKPARVETVALQPLDLAQLAALIESLGLPELDVERLAPALLQAHRRQLDVRARDAEGSGPLRPGGDARRGRRGCRSRSASARWSSAAWRSCRARRCAWRASPRSPAPDFSAELAAAVLEAHPLDIAEPWRELETAQVLRDGAFAHDLIFEATRESVPRADRPAAAPAHRRAPAGARGAARAASRRTGPARPNGALAGEAYAAAARRARRGLAAHATRSSAGAAPARPSTRPARRTLAFDARCESIHALIVVHGVTHAQHGRSTRCSRRRDSDAQRAAALTAKATAALMAADHPAGIAAAVQAARAGARLRLAVAGLRRGAAARGRPGAGRPRRSRRWR